MEEGSTQVALQPQASPGCCSQGSMRVSESPLGAPRVPLCLCQLLWQQFVLLTSKEMGGGKF